MNKRPNFLFLFSDQHRGDWMPYDRDTKTRLGVSQLELEMPNIRGLMDRGTAFSSAISPAPVCAPARACLASGKRYRNCRVSLNNVNYDPALTSFYKRLSEAGYYVCGTGKFDLNKGDLEWGDGFHSRLKEIGFTYTQDNEGKMDTIWAALLDKPGPYGRMLKEAGWLERHKEDMMYRAGSPKATPLPDELYADNWITSKSKKMLMNLPHDHPWFMQVNFSGPHDPWDITEKMKSKVAGRSFPEAADCTICNDNAEVRQNYAAMIENIDRSVGELMEVLIERGELENTIIVYGADHGEMMGDHDLYGKSKPGQGAIHIPMVIDASYFEGKGGICNKTPVELQDLAATFLDYAGLEIPEEMESKSLRPIVEGKSDSVRQYAISELISSGKGAIGSFGVITDGRYKLIMKNNQKDSLFDLSSDPFECNDIIKHFPQEVERLRYAFDNRGQKRNPIFDTYAKVFTSKGKEES